MDQLAKTTMKLLPIVRQSYLISLSLLCWSFFQSSSIAEQEQIGLLSLINKKKTAGIELYSERLFLSERRFPQTSVILHQYDVTIPLIPIELRKTARKDIYLSTYGRVSEEKKKQEPRENEREKRLLLDDFLFPIHQH
jgi:hypothetical protein